MVVQALDWSFDTCAVMSMNFAADRTMYWADNCYYSVGNCYLANNCCSTDNYWSIDSNWWTEDMGHRLPLSANTQEKHTFGNLIDLIWFRENCHFKPVFCIE